MKDDTRELEAWIAVNLFGWVKTDVKCHPSDNRTINGFLYSPNGFNGDLNQSSAVPHYTTDPAAAMQVLQKCSCETTNIEIDFRDGDTFAVGTYRRAGGIKEAEADTLPLAIALFAKALFSK